MQKRYYNIVIFPESLGNPKKFKISKIWLRLSVGLFSLCFLSIIGSTVFFAHRYFAISKGASGMGEWRAETKTRKLHIQKFEKQVKDFEKQLARLEKFDKKLRIITAIEQAEDAAPKKWGIGGPPNKNLSDAKLLSNASAIEGLSFDLDQLKAQADLQEISFFQLDQFFKDRKSLLSSTPSIWPTKGWVTSGFGYRKSPYTGAREMHEGVDIAARMKSAIGAPADGIVVRAGRDYGLGVMLEIDHGYGVLSRYGHNSKNLVKVGDRVKRGQKIAFVGNTGRSTGPHLHYEVLLNGIPVNPMRYIIE
jgi:murein DD-endopeptidase MepM/ murein hydrolase activator NlpD